MEATYNAGLSRVTYVGVPDFNLAKVSASVGSMGVEVVGQCWSLSDFQAIDWEHGGRSAQDNIGALIALDSHEDALRRSVGDSEESVLSIPTVLEEMDLQDVPRLLITNGAVDIPCAVVDSFTDVRMVTKEDARKEGMTAYSAEIIDFVMSQSGVFVPDAVPIRV